MTTFPRNVSLSIEHNSHANNYQTAKEWLDDLEDSLDWRADWVSEEERTKALQTGEIWELQWYPDTPVGFYHLLASSFEALMATANEPGRFE
ncbi:MAG: hypothetical protein ACR2QH_15155 [Geminicoccaceae bacterium]